MSESKRTLGSWERTGAGYEWDNYVKIRLVMMDVLETIMAKIGPDPAKESEKEVKKEIEALLGDDA